MEPRNHGKWPGSRRRRRSGRQQLNAESLIANSKAGVVERGMFTPRFSEELERPDDFHVGRAGRRSRRNKLPARKLAAPASEGRPEVGGGHESKQVSTWYGNATETIASRTSIRSRSTLIVEKKGGNSTPEDPLDRGEVPGHGAEDGKHQRETELGRRVNETDSDSGTGEEDVRDGADHAGSSHRRQSVAGSVWASPKGRSPRDRRSHGQGVRSESGDEPERSAQAVQERDVLRASSEAELHPESRWRPARSGRSDSGRQGIAESRDDGAGGDL